MSGPTPGPDRRRATIIGGVAWVLSVVQYAVIQVVAVAAWQAGPAGSVRPYSLRDNVISDLGNTACGPRGVPQTPSSFVCSPLHAVVNGSFVAAGILTLLGVVLLRRWWPDGGTATTAWWFWILAGIGKIVVGLVPENSDIGLHLLGALNIPLSAVGALLFSLAIRRRAHTVAGVGIVLAVAGLVGLILLVLAPFLGSAAYLGLGYGGAERLAGYPGDAWMLLIGSCALVRWSTPIRRPQRSATVGAA